MRYLPQRTQVGSIDGVKAMSIFGSIMSKIFGNHPAAAQDASTAGQPADTAAPAAATPSTPSASAPPSGLSTPGTTMAPVDVGAILTDMAAKNGQNLNWKQSIVDLMKLLGLDSSLDARKSLAQELNYSGDTSDSASMNIWLHKQVMNKLAENGGKVPAELKD
jgi:hypothetical protein